jgi:uncharacterized protein
MMLIATYVGPSAINGIGVFTKEPITKGQEVWHFETELSLVIEPEKLSALPSPVRKFVKKYAFRHPKSPENLILEADDGRFMNHSIKPNLDLSSKMKGIALRDIDIDEELTCNYADIS